MDFAETVAHVALHSCPYGNGRGGNCIYYDHNDELCLACLKESRKYINRMIRKLRKEKLDGKS